MLAASAPAGPPAICWPVEIGDAKSLPWGKDAFATDERYDEAKTVDDTLALLDGAMPVLVRMETLRRATIYLDDSRSERAELLRRLMIRVLDAEAAGKPSALAWFELEGRNGASAYVPRGASCRIDPAGPGVPFFPGAPEGLLDPAAAGLDEALALSRPHDALTLWHLLARVGAGARGRVCDRLAALAPPPPEAPRDAVLRLDRAALLAWRASLPLP
jgi:hypothetical protein